MRLPIRIEYEQGFVDMTQHKELNVIWQDDFVIMKDGEEISFEEMIQHLMEVGDESEQEKIIETLEKYGLSDILIGDGDDEEK